MQKFECPSCGAALDYDGGDDPVVSCSYCGSMAIVPEDLRSPQPEQQPVWTATPLAGGALTIDLSGLSGKVAKLKAIKQLVRDGEVPEAARVYQESFGASAEEAEGVVGRLASGQSVVISSSTAFSSNIPVVSGEQAAEMLREQMGVTLQRQRKVNRAVGCIVIAALLIIFAITIIVGVAITMFS